MMGVSITPEIIEIIKLFSTDPTIKIPEYDATDAERPTHATIREIDISVAGPRIEARFSRANFDIDISDYAGGLTEILEKIRSGTMTYPDKPKPGPGVKYSTLLSLGTNKFVYVIFVLTGKNWQFSYNRPPIGMSTKAATEGYYHECRRVDQNGNADNGFDPAVTRHGCKIAYFSANGKLATSGVPSEYCHPFNLHVDIVTEDSDGRPSYIPLTIDPDIRFPGGSGAGSGT